MKKLLASIMVLSGYFSLAVSAATITTQGNKVLKDGSPFFALGVYYQQTQAKGYANSWRDELQNNGFNTVNLMDPHPVYPGYSYNPEFEGFISANQTDIPFLVGRYDNPANAQNIFALAAAHNILVIADQGPFTPDGAQGLNEV